MFVASAPLAREPYGAAAVPASQYGFEQVLFGFEAQLRAFDHVLRNRGRTLGLAPLPELFSTPRSRTVLTRAASAGTGPNGQPPSLLHLRFGPARHARILKGAGNIMVLADDPLHRPVGGSAHPFGSDTHLPAPFSTVLTYAPRRAPPVAAGHVALPTEVLSEAFISADLDVEAVGATRHDFEPAPNWMTVEGLHVRSFAEFLASDWVSPGATAHSSEAHDWRHALALAHADDPIRPGCILLPWNLANPASLVPDLVLKLSRRTLSEAAIAAVVLFPFNTTPTTGPAVAELVATTRETAGARVAGLRTLFLARLTSLRDAQRLRRIFPLAWLESEDPESDWTACRLSRLGIDHGFLGTRPAVPPDFAIVPEEAIRLRLSDSFGERFYAGRTVSTRQLAVLLMRSRDAVAAAVAGAPPKGSSPDAVAS